MLEIQDWEKDSLDMSIEAWINLREDAPITLFGIFGEQVKLYVKYDLDSLSSTNKLWLVCMYGLFYEEEFTSLSVKEWHHIALVSSELSIYVNVKLVLNGAEVLDLNVTKSNFRPHFEFLGIGKNKRSVESEGELVLKELRYWKYPRATREIRENRRVRMGGEAVRIRSLIGHFPFSRYGDLEAGEWRDYSNHGNGMRHTNSPYTGYIDLTEDPGTLLPPQLLFPTEGLILCSPPTKYSEERESCELSAGGGATPAYSLLLDHAAITLEMDTTGRALSSDWTAEIWVKIIGYTGYLPNVLQSLCSNQGILFEVTSASTLHFLLKSLPSNKVSLPYALNRWMHLAIRGSISGETTSVWVNAQDEITLAGTTGNIWPSSCDILLGDSNGSSLLYALMKEFRLWSSLRSIHLLKHFMHRYI